MGNSSLIPSFETVHRVVHGLRGFYAAKNIKPHDILATPNDSKILGQRIRTAPEEQFVFITTSKIEAALTSLPLHMTPIIVAGDSVTHRLDLLLSFSKDHNLLGQPNCHVLFLSGQNPVTLTQEHILRRQALKKENMQFGYTGPPSNNGMAPTH